LKDAVQAYLADPVPSQPGVEPPTVQGLMNALLAKLVSSIGDSAQGSFSTGPVTISGGIFPDDEEFRLDIALDYNQDFSFPLDLGSGLSALGLQADSSGVSLNLTAHAGVQFTIGFDIGKLFEGNGIDPARDLFIQIEKASIGATATLDIPSLSVSADFGGGTTGSLGRSISVQNNEKKK